MLWSCMEQTNTASCYSRLILDHISGKHMMSAFLPLLVLTNRSYFLWYSVISDFRHSPCGFVHWCINTHHLVYLLSILIRTVSRTCTCMATFFFLERIVNDYNGWGLLFLDHFKPFQISSTCFLATSSRAIIFVYTCVFRV